MFAVKCMWKVCFSFSSCCLIINIRKSQAQLTALSHIVMKISLTDVPDFAYNHRLSKPKLIDFQNHSRKYCLYASPFCCQPVDPLLDRKSISLSGVNMQLRSAYVRGRPTGSKPERKSKKVCVSERWFVFVCVIGCGCVCVHVRMYTNSWSVSPSAYQSLRFPPPSPWGIR